LSSRGKRRRQKDVIEFSLDIVVVDELSIFLGLGQGTKQYIPFVSSTMVSVLFMSEQSVRTCTSFLSGSKRFAATYFLDVVHRRRFNLLKTRIALLDTCMLSYGISLVHSRGPHP
jgi:hypothetical protein